MRRATICANGKSNNIELLCILTYSYNFIFVLDLIPEIKLVDKFILHGDAVVPISKVPKLINPVPNDIVPAIVVVKREAPAPIKVDEAFTVFASILGHLNIVEHFKSSVKIFAPPMFCALTLSTNVESQYVLFVKWKLLLGFVEHKGTDVNVYCPFISCVKWLALSTYVASVKFLVTN